MERRSEALVDVMRVPVDGDPSVAVVAVGNLADARVIECDVLIVGGGTGGVAAALAAARRGRHVHLIEETDWIGGQLTAQGVSALDEHEHIEAFGGTASYYQLRNMLRDHYRPLAGEAGKHPHFNPGNCWVTRVAFEPKVAVAAMMALLQPHVDAGRLSLHLRAKAAAAEVEDDRIVSVTTRRSRGWALRSSFAPPWCSTRPSSATCCRSSAPNTVVGAETIAETGEAHAQPSDPEAALRAKLHLCVRARAAAARRAPRDRAAGTLRVLSCFPTLQPDHRGARRRDLRRGERLARATRSSRPCPARRAGCGPIAG